MRLLLWIVHWGAIDLKTNAPFLPIFQLLLSFLARYLEQLLMGYSVDKH